MLKAARLLGWCGLLALLGGVVPAPGGRGPGGMPTTDRASDPAAARTVFLGGSLSPDAQFLFTATIAASGHPGVVLMDHPASRPYLRHLLAELKPDRVIPVGQFTGSRAAVEAAAGPLSAGAGWGDEHPIELWKLVFPTAERVVVCPTGPRRLVYRAACFAGLLRAPLFLTDGRAGAALALRDRVVDWRAREVYAVGDGRDVCRGLPGVRVLPVGEEDDLRERCLDLLARGGPVETLVIANPADLSTADAGSASALAPWLALTHRAALLLTNPAGDNVRELVADAARDPRLKGVENLILAGTLEALPVEQRPNPIKGKDTVIEAEPCTPSGDQPWSYAVGRLFHPDPGVLLMMQARQRLLSDPARHRDEERTALIASNGGQTLPLLETFSRQTARELERCGYKTTTMFGADVRPDRLRALLPGQHVFLWEGHHNLIIKDYALPQWDEPLPSSLVVLQSCLGLSEWKLSPLLRRGAVGVVASPNRIFSGSGGAFSLAYLDALMYDDQTVGGALRSAKNFELACALLAEKRLGAAVVAAAKSETEAALASARLTAPNLRTGWAFALWGDPTLRLPAPARPATEDVAVRYRVDGDDVTVLVPPPAGAPVKSRNYRASAPPNARLMSLVRHRPRSKLRRLTPLVFVEVPLADAPDRAVPRLSASVPGGNWVALWDDRRRALTILAAPGPQDRTELRFHIDWTDGELAGTGGPSAPAAGTGGAGAD